MKFFSTFWKSFFYIIIIVLIIINIGLLVSIIQKSKATKNYSSIERFNQVGG